MKYLYFLYILIILTFIQCTYSSREKELIDENWTRVNLPNKENVLVDSFSISKLNYFPDEIALIDSLLIVRNLKSNPIFNVFYLPKMDYIGSFRILGKGPQEFLVAPQIRKHDSLLLLTGVKKIQLITLPKHKISNNFKVVSEYVIPGKIHPLNQTFTLGNGIYYGIVFGGYMKDIQNRKELVYFDSKTNKIDSSIEFPRTFFRGVTHNDFLYPKFITVSPQNNKFAFFYSLYPLIRIFNDKLEINKEIWVDNLPKQIKFKTKGENSNIFFGYHYYKKVVSSKSFIYALYFNDKGIKENDSYQRVLISNPELHIFNWDGKPIRRIVLRKGTSAIEISDDEKYLYSTEIDIADKIFRYSL